MDFVKQVKRWISALLVLCLCLALLPSISTHANAAATVTAQRVADYFKGRVGESYGNGLCLKFVRTGFEALGGTTSSSCCAYNYGNSFIDSTDINTIPLGADVFFGNCGGGPCGTCGASYYGHIGVYVGDGYFVHATGGTVQKTAITSTYWSSRFRGWGYHGGITITSGTTIGNLGLTPVDIGTNFTAVILNKNIWKPIENSYTEGDKPPVRLANEDGFANQVWHFTRQSDNSYKIASCYDGKYLDVRNASTSINTIIQTCVDTGSDAQKWYICEYNGGYVFVSKLCNYVMDLNNNDGTPGNYVQTHEWNKTNAQIWSIYRGQECVLKSPSMTVSVGDAKTATVFKWGNVYAARNYNVKIWKGTAWDGEQYAGANNVTSGYSVVLPAGTYQAYVDAVHQFDYEMSNLVTFTVKEHTHSNTYKVTKSPTTSATGTLTGTCSKCSGTTTITLPKLNTTDYTYKITKSATCTASGTGRYTWKTTTYGTFYFDVTIAAKGHTYTSKVTAPTCTEQGYTTHTCACGHSYKDSYTNATGHSYSYKATKSPTTSATGTLTGTCSKCSGTTTITLPKLNTTDYTYKVTKSATCTASGTGRYTWKTTTYGSFYFDVSISAKGHSYTSKVTAPTCTEQGYTTYTCACGHTYKDNYTAATGHSFGEWVVIKLHPNDTGIEVRTCTRCGYAETRAISNPANPFTDVPSGSFYEAPVLWAVENGITNGATDTTFNPDGQCLRAQVVTFLHRTAGNPAPSSTKNPFTDVKTGDFFYKPVLWAVEKGITNGVSATRFGSYDVCNRAAVVTFLWRAAGSPEPNSTRNPFNDVKSTDFFYKPVLWAVEKGITNGLSATEFGPTANCNRAQVVTFLYRAYN